MIFSLLSKYSILKREKIRKPWSGQSGSNRREELGRLTCYRYIMAARTYGRGERIRTSDPLVPNQVRYQTALRPETTTAQKLLQP